VPIQLGAARHRGGIEPLIFGRHARVKYDTAGPKLPLRIVVQTDSAILQNLAALIAKGDRQQEFGASVDPLYLFSCGVTWHKQRDASARWELIQFLRSRDKGTRAIGAALLGKTEHARLLVRDLRRARIHVAKPVTGNWAVAVGGGPAGWLK
jgi:hypothetical protein